MPMGDHAVRAVYAGRKVDATAKALTAACKQLGVECAPLGGAIDAVIWWGPVVRLIDWKTPGKSITDSQGKLVARGLPIAFISTVEQLQAVVAEMRREATR